MLYLNDIEQGSKWSKRTENWLTQDCKESYSLCQAIKCIWVNHADFIVIQRQSGHLNKKKIFHFDMLKCLLKIIDYNFSKKFCNYEVSIDDKSSTRVVINFIRERHHLTSLSLIDLSSNTSKLSPSNFKILVTSNLLK